MKTIVAVLLLCAFVACAMGQAYNYGYNTYTPGARVSHYASSVGAVPVAAAPYVPAYGAGYNYAYGAGAYPYKWY